MKETSTAYRKAIEPDSAVCTVCDNDTQEHEMSLNRKQQIRLVVATLLFALGSIFNRALHDSPYSIAEYAVLLSAYFLVGFPVLSSAVKSIIKGQVFNEMFLMSVATVGAIIIHQLPEAVGVMLFYSVGEYLQERSVNNSRRSIISLMDLRPESARLIAAEGQKIVHPKEVKIGDLIEVLPGERIPLDGEIVEGFSFVTTSALTGESVPRRIEAGDKVLAGFMNDEGRIVFRVEKEFNQSTASKILELMQNAGSHKAPTEKFITRFAAFYTPAVVAIAMLIAFIPPLLIPGAKLSDWVYRALVVLVISCPCALVLSVPLSYFGGIGGASRQKVLIKGAHLIDALSKVDTVVFDKTGTLTEGVFKVVDVVTRNGFSKEELLKWAAAAESCSSHPIARSIIEAVEGPLQAADDIREIKGYGLLARIGDKSIIVGNDKLLKKESISHDDGEAEGTVVYLAVDHIYAGYILISDQVKSGAAQTMSALKALGVRKLAMLTGDNATVASRVAQELKLDEYYAELMPDEKVRKIEEFEEDAHRNGAIAFVGDGMNDAPVIVRSDIGFAMGGIGSDAAIEAADVVVMDDDISRIPTALRIATFTRRIVRQNITLALIGKGIFIVLGTVGIAGMWEAVIADVGVSLIAVLNALRTVRH